MSVQAKLQSKTTKICTTTIKHMYICTLNKCTYVSQTLPLTVHMLYKPFHSK